MKTEWHELEEFPEYAVNNLGEVANMKTGLYRKPAINQQGILRVGLYKDRVLCTRSIAVLVANAFLEPPRSETFNTPIHLDGDRRNCKAINLMWRPRWFAIKYHRQFYKDVFYKGERQIMDEDTGVVYENMKHLCTTLGVYDGDVVNSYNMGNPVFPDSHTFRLV